MEWFPLHNLTGWILDTMFTTPCVARDTCHTSRDWCHMSLARCPISHVWCHMSPLTPKPEELGPEIVREGLFRLSIIDIFLGFFHFYLTSKVLFYYKFSRLLTNCNWSVCTGSRWGAEMTPGLLEWLTSRWTDCSIPLVCLIAYIFNGFIIGL